MFATKGRLKVALWFVGILVIVGGLHVFLTPTTIEADNANDCPWHGHHEIIERKYDFCGSVTFLVDQVGEWTYRESCMVVYFEKARYKWHGESCCSGCGKKGDHWVYDPDCPWGGYYSCISSRSICNEN